MLDYIVVSSLFDYIYVESLIGITFDDSQDDLGTLVVLPPGFHPGLYCCEMISSFANLILLCYLCSHCYVRRCSSTGGSVGS